jgi:hypothetical protein
VYTRLTLLESTNFRDFPALSHAHGKRGGNVDEDFAWRGGKLLHFYEVSMMFEEFWKFK